MKQKLLVLVFSTALFTMGFFSYSCYAASLNDFKNSSYQNGLVVTIVPSGDTFIYSVCYDHYVYSWEVNGNYLYSGNGSSFNIIYNVGFNPLAEPDRNLTYVNSTTSVNVTGGQVIALKGFITQSGNGNVTIFENEEDYNTSLNPPSYWETVWDEFWNALEIIGDGLEKADDGLWNWIKNLFIDENETPDYNSILVTPAPTPTPIPVTYQTVTVPDGNGGSITANQYVYQDTNNNTIIATAIPTNGIVINLPSGNNNTGGNENGGGGISDPSNYSPANPLAIPNLEWLNPHAFAENQNQFPLETLQNAEDFTKEASENYLTGVTGIFSLLTFIPSELYAVIGIGISIIVITGIMCKLLGG